MKSRLSKILIGFFILSHSIPCYGQAPDLGTIANFEIFTCNGAIANVGTSKLLGNVGSDIGDISGFINPTVLVGTIYSADTVTARGTADLNAAYNQLMINLPAIKHGAIYGNKEIIYAGTDSTGCAASISDTLILDAKGDSNAVFIFKIDGAFNTTPNSAIQLINGASACNVFWVINGAVSMATYSSMKGVFIANGALSAAANCTFEGRLLSLKGAVSISSTTAFVPLKCFVNYWTGAAGNTSWFTKSNWTSIVPDGITATNIPPSTINNRLLPSIDSGLANVNVITVQKNAGLVVSNSTLQINGLILNSGTINAALGSINMNGLPAQILSPNLFAGDSIHNLIISNSVTLTGRQLITGSVSFNGNNLSLVTNDSLVLVSNATATAQLSDLTKGGQQSGNTITGKITVERFIPARRAWRLLAVPLIYKNAPTINAAWQEGVTTASVNPNPNPGFGTQITGGDFSAGFDKGINTNPSVKIYNSSLNLLTGLPVDLGTQINIASYPAYFIFIRGDRSTNLQQGALAATSNTTLRMFGNVNIGKYDVVINAANYTLVGNPYPAAINLHTISRSANLKDRFFLWDPKMSAYGGYVTFSWNGTSYDSTESVSPLSRFIPGGEAFFIPADSAGNAGSVSINETDKNNGGSDNAFRPMAISANLRIGLSTVKTTNATANLVDGVLSCYSDNYDNEVTEGDVHKMYNLAENICLARNNQLLSIEQRQTIKFNDTSFLKLYRLKKQQYLFTIKAANMANSGLKAVLKDKYDTAINNSIINLNGKINTIAFTVNTDSGSFAPDRFYIVYLKALLPFAFTGVDGKIHQKNILINFKTKNNLAIKTYSLQTSATLSDFKIISTNAPLALKDTADCYSFLNFNVSEGNHYYRIVAVDFTGKQTFSPIINIKVNWAENGIKACPTLIKNNSVVFKLNNIPAGNYIVKLLSPDGKLIKSITIRHVENDVFKQTFLVNGRLAAGKYLLLLTGNTLQSSTYIIKE